MQEGVVLEIYKNSVGVMTPFGQFLKVRKDVQLCDVGEEIWFREADIIVPGFKYNFKKPYFPRFAFQTVTASILLFTFLTSGLHYYLAAGYQNKDILSQMSEFIGKKFNHYNNSNTVAAATHYNSVTQPSPNSKLNGIEPNFTGIHTINNPPVKKNSDHQSYNNVPFEYEVALNNLTTSAGSINASRSIVKNNTNNIGDNANGKNSTTTKNVSSNSTNSSLSNNESSNSSETTNVNTSTPRPAQSTYVGSINWNGSNQNNQTNQNSNNNKSTNENSNDANSDNSSDDNNKNHNISGNNVVTNNNIQQQCKQDGYYTEIENILTFEKNAQGQVVEVYKDMPIRRYCGDSNPSPTSSLTGATPPTNGSKPTTGTQPTTEVPPVTSTSPPTDNSSPGHVSTVGDSSSSYSSNPGSNSSASETNNNTSTNTSNNTTNNTNASSPTNGASNGRSTVSLVG